MRSGGRRCLFVRACEISSSTADGLVLEEENEDEDEDELKREQKQWR